MLNTCTKINMDGLNLQYAILTTTYVRFDALLNTDSSLALQIDDEKITPP